MISVIVPIYKAEKYLSQCVESVLNQTYRDFELILVDDGSPDRCGEICDEYASQDGRIKVVHQANGGFSAARNAGLDLATGEFLTFVDSDDYLHKETFEVLYRALTDNDADFSMCYYEKVSEAGEIIPDPDVVLEGGTLSGPDVIRNYQNFSTLYLSTLYIVPWNKLFKRELFSDVRFPLGKCHEDTFTFYKIFYKSSRIVRVPRRLYFYRQNPNGFMAQGVTFEKSLCYLEALSEGMEFFEKHDLRSVSERLATHLADAFFAFRKNFSIVNPVDVERFNVIKKRVRFFIYRYRKHFKAREIVFFESPRLFEFLSSVKKRVKK